MTYIILSYSLAKKAANPHTWEAGTSYFFSTFGLNKWLKQVQKKIKIDATFSQQLKGYLEFRYKL